MANVAIGSGLDDRLAGLHGYLIGEKLPKKGHRIGTKCDAEEHECDAVEKDGGAMPSDVGLRKKKAQGEGGNQCQPQEQNDYGVGAAITGVGAIRRTMTYSATGFKRQP